MAQNFTDLGQKLNLVGGAGGQLVSGTYTPGVTFYADAAQELSAALALMFDAATTVTDIRVKLQGRHATWPAGRWEDIQTTRLSNGNVAAEQVFVASAGGQAFDTIKSTGAHKFFDGGLQLVAEATGGATRAGDTVVSEVKAW